MCKASRDCCNACYINKTELKYASVQVIPIHEHALVLTIRFMWCSWTCWILVRRVFHVQIYSQIFEDLNSVSLLQAVFFHQSTWQKWHRKWHETGVAHLKMHEGGNKLFAWCFWTFLVAMLLLLPHCCSHVCVFIETMSYMH